MRMDTSTIFGGLFVAPYLWGLFQLVVIGNPANAIFLIAFFWIVKTLTGDEQKGLDKGGMDSENPSVESVEVVKDVNTSPPSDPAALELKNADVDASGDLINPDGNISKIEVDSAENVQLDTPAGGDASSTLVTPKVTDVVKGAMTSPSAHGCATSILVTPKVTDVVKGAVTSPSAHGCATSILVEPRVTDEADLVKGSLTFFPYGQGYPLHSTMRMGTRDIPLRMDASEVKLLDTVKPKTIRLLDPCCLKVGDQPDRAFFVNQKLFFIQHRLKWLDLKRRAAVFTPSLSSVEEEGRGGGGVVPGAGGSAATAEDTLPTEGARRRRGGVKKLLMKFFIRCR